MNYAYKYYHSCIYISDAHRIMYFFCGHASDLNSSCIETAGSVISCFFSSHWWWCDRTSLHMFNKVSNYANIYVNTSKLDILY